MTTDDALPGFDSHGAILSPDGVYRYVLTRRWAPGGVSAVFVMLNPSTADAERDDPTIRRCIGFAGAMGCTGLTVVNLYALRATDPQRLATSDWDPVGPDNDHHLRRQMGVAAAVGAPIIAAWGAGHTDVVPGRVAAVLALPGGDRMMSLGVTLSGAPRHPLYVPKTVRPTPWSPA